MTPQRTKHPLTPDEVREIASKLHPRYGQMVWAMALTGMGPEEYWSLRWHQYADRVHIVGTKRAGRVRDVPCAHSVTPPSIMYAAFRRYLREASEGRATPYDLRRTYANWLESAGVPRTRRRLYMGHGTKDVTDLYEFHEITAFLKEDAERLKSYVVGTENTATLKLVEK